MEINEIHLGDAYELIKRVPDHSVDLIVTDPPYEIKGLSDGGGVLKGRNNSYVSQMVSASLGDGIDLSILPEFVRVMKKINCYIWCNKEQIYDYLTFFVKERRCNWEMIVWAKTNPPPFNNGHYLKDKEYCLYFWETGVELKPSFETGRTVYLSSTNVTDKDRYGHPTIKPEEIIANLIRNSCGGGRGLILDPFCGSGTTCAVAKRLGHDYLGFEIDPKYHRVAKDRLEGFDAKGQGNLFDL